MSLTVSPIVSLLVCRQVLYLLSFWLLLHQTLTERQDKLKEEATLFEVSVESEKKGELE